MSDGKANLVERAFRVSLFALGIAMVLNLAIGYLHAVWPWLVGSAATGAMVWVVIAIVRWRRSKW